MQKERLTIIDEKRFAYGDSDRKVIIFGNSRAFEMISQKMQLLHDPAVQQVRINGTEPDSLEMLVSIGEHTGCFIELGRVELYVDVTELDNIIEGIYGLSKRGSYITIDPYNYDAPGIMECYFAHYPQSTQMK